MFIDIILINKITIPENGVGGDDELGLLVSLDAALFVEADDGVAQYFGEVVIAEAVDAVELVVGDLVILNFGEVPS